MKNEIISKMQQDMHIKQYNGEPKSRFIGRILYSALCQWMRYSIVDETTPFYDRKSKVYILSKMKKVLDNMTDSFPESIKWIYGDTSNVADKDEIIRGLREKMLFAGELVEVDENHNIALPAYTKKSCVIGYKRILGLTNEDLKGLEYIGITRICNNSDSYEKSHLLESRSIDNYLNWLFLNTSWGKVTCLDDYEFFNPYSKKPPYQSWTNIIPKETDRLLARITLYNGMHEYHIITKNQDEYSNAALTPVLQEWKEERRAILALRRAVNNPMLADYYDKGSVCILNLFCGIPLKEQIILDTFCWPLNSMSDKYNYVVPKVIWEEIEAILSGGLGIKLRVGGNTNG